MAKAEAGKTYAVIQNGKCHEIFTASKLPEWNENNIQVVDVTTNIPAIGDAWNDSSFEPYVAPPLTQEQINVAADNAIATIRRDSFPAILDVLTKLATGADKTALKVFDDAVKVEKAKKL